MKLEEAERGPLYQLREVSDLKIQFLCEYRLHLKQKLGETHSDSSVTGAILHRTLSNQYSTFRERRANRLYLIIIAAITIVAGILWILW
ncbi:MAG: hypothetical protein ACFFCP_01590 [Promethearchaeota archaeon]